MSSAMTNLYSHVTSHCHQVTRCAHKQELSPVLPCRSLVVITCLTCLRHSLISDPAGGQHSIIHRPPGFPEAHWLQLEVSLRRWQAWPCQEEERQEGRLRWWRWWLRRRVSGTPVIFSENWEMLLCIYLFNKHLRLITRFSIWSKIIYPRLNISY